MRELLSGPGEAFHATELPLRYTPRRMALHPQAAPSALTVAVPHGQQLAAIIESDTNVVGTAELPLPPSLRKRPMQLLQAVALLHRARRAAATVAHSTACACRGRLGGCDGC